MLHLIFQSPTPDAVLDRVDCGDDVVFLENAVFQLNKGGVFLEKLPRLRADNIFLYALQEELEIRGIEVDKSVTVINYAGLVTLTEKNIIIKTWN